MAKIVRRKKKKKLRIGFTAIFCLTSILIYGLTSLLVRTYNNNLSIKLQEINSQIAQIELTNDELKTDIMKLQNRDRVTSIAADNEMDYNLANIVVLTTE